MLGDAAFTALAGNCFPSVIDTVEAKTFEAAGLA